MHVPLKLSLTAGTFEAYFMWGEKRNSWQRERV